MLSGQRGKPSKKGNRRKRETVRQGRPQIHREADRSVGSERVEGVVAVGAEESGQDMDKHRDKKWKGR